MIADHEFVAAEDEFDSAGRLRVKFPHCVARVRGGAFTCQQPRSAHATPPRATDPADPIGALVAEVRRLHCWEHYEGQPETCHRCDVEWPCAAIRAADALTTQRAELQRALRERDEALIEPNGLRTALSRTEREREALGVERSIIIAVAEGRMSPDTVWEEALTPGLRAVVKATQVRNAIEAKLADAEARGREAANTVTVHGQVVVDRINEAYSLGREAALEEAAKACEARCTPGITKEWLFNASTDNEALRCAAAIRALKGKP